jgi:DNA-binding Xre family transcriptional regulator
MIMPNDPVMLLSYINMKLRDEYSSLESLCDDLDVNMDDILEKLKNINYYYDKEQNQFK